MAKKFKICEPDPKRARGLHAGGCPHPSWCLEKRECYYGKDGDGRGHDRQLRELTPEEARAIAIARSQADDDVV